MLCGPTRDQAIPLQPDGETEAYRELEVLPRQGGGLLPVHRCMHGRRIEEKAGKDLESCHHHHQHGNRLFLTECRDPDTPPAASHELTYLILISSPEGGVSSSNLLIREPVPGHREAKYPARGHTDSSGEHGQEPKPVARAGSPTADHPRHPGSQGH